MTRNCEGDDNEERLYVENKYDDDGDGGHCCNDYKHTVEIEFSLFDFFSSDS